MTPSALDCLLLAALDCLAAEVAAEARREPAGGASAGAQGIASGAAGVELRHELAVQRVGEERRDDLRPQHVAREVDALADAEPIRAGQVVRYYVTCTDGALIGGTKIICCFAGYIWPKEIVSDALTR